jgi:hypothetical protein
MSTTAPLPEALLSMRTKPLFRLVIHVPQLLVVGPTPDALRRVGVIDGGSFTGDRLSGAVVSGIGRPFVPTTALRSTRASSSAPPTTRSSP